jgi:hypothetical protein
MVLRNTLFVIIPFMFFAGCITTSEMDHIEVEAQRHMAIADTLERAAELKQATLEYALVAERFPTSSVYATAVRKAAFLYSQPDNPAASDSASRFWLNTYFKLSQSPEEKQLIQMYLNLADLVQTLKDSLARQKIIHDGLVAAARKQGNEMAARSKRIQELESDLKNASDELHKLKEIDLRISKSRVKNKP